MGIRVNGVSFSVELCRGMSREEFIKKHSGHFEGMNDEDRNKVLSDTYDKISPPSKKSVKKISDNVSTDK